MHLGYARTWPPQQSNSCPWTGHLGLHVHLRRVRPLGMPATNSAKALLRHNRAAGVKLTPFVPAQPGTDAFSDFPKHMAHEYVDPYKRVIKHERQKKNDMLSGSFFPGSGGRTHCTRGVFNAQAYREATRIIMSSLKATSWGRLTSRITHVNSGTTRIRSARSCMRPMARLCALFVIAS